VGKFADDLKLFADKVHRRGRQVFVGSVVAVHESVVEGSPLTGAPGQPVDTGFLKSSWIPAFPGEWLGEVSTNVSYAPVVEAGGDRSLYDARGVDRPPRKQIPGSTNYKGPSVVGGPHSVALTRASWDRIVESEVTKAKETI